MVNETDFRHWLEDMLYTAMEEAGDNIEIKSFTEAGLMTNDEGLVVELESGEEFQLTIVKSREGKQG